MDLQVRHLRVLCAIADSGSISRAAATLKMSQPALTAQLRRIEQMFGDPLFDRGPEGARPTRLGEWLLVRSRSLVSAVDELERTAKRYAPPQGEMAPIRVGCAPTRLRIYLARTLRQLLPGAEIRLLTEQTIDTLPGMLESERIELATLDDYPDHRLSPPPGAVYTAIAVEPLFVGLPSNHPLAKQDEIELRDLAEEDWALPAPLESGPREYFWSTCAEHGFTPRVAYGVNLEVGVDLVAEGRCVSLFQATAPAREGIAIRPLADSPLRFRHLIGWTAPGPITAHADDLVRALTTTYWTESQRAPAYRDWLERHGPLKQL
ncbi:LysR family transcriptional regulator [Streptosporangium sp. NPDC051023]|uniref:LysR substrate-binding domain-containing protein n=1 Tax=Streptosporangium sp. NPDC051023 TaxID=3155410 RepID=UPI0034510DC6